MTAPKGRDLAVWRNLVAEPELARFIQRPITDVGDRILERAQVLLAQNPSSTYAPYLEKALRERREFEAQVRH